MNTVGYYIQHIMYVIIMITLVKTSIVKNNFLYNYTQWLITFSSLAQSLTPTPIHAVNWSRCEMISQ